MLATPQALAAGSAKRLRTTLGSRAFVWLLPSVALVLWARPGLRWPLALGYDLALLLCFAWDARRLRKQRVHVERDVESRLVSQLDTTYGLSVEHRGDAALRVRVRDTAPAHVELTPEEHALTLVPGQRARLEARIFPRARGRGEFGDLWLALETRLGLARVVVRLEASAEIRVVPQTTLERGRGRQGPRLDAGAVAVRVRRSPQGTDLESLREYVASDPLKAVDWKATAKRHHPITRLYQPERSQVLWLVLDASRTMAAAIGDGNGQARATKTRFDVALAASLVLADGALRAGDQVGALVYGDGASLLVPPGRGRAHYRRLVDALSEAHAAQVQLDVRGLVAELERRAKKRSLLVLFTDLENESHGDALCEHARLLTRRHLTLCVSLDDTITSELADASPRSEDDVYQRAAAIDLLRERTELEQRLSKRGVLVLEAHEEGLARATLERYLEIKTHARL